MEFVNFELAKKLKERGFNEECFGWYYPSEVCGFDYKTTIVFNSSEYRGSNYKDMLVSHNDEKHIDVPTIYQVLKWLREEKKIYLEIVIVVDTEYMCDIYKINPRPIECLGSTEYFKTYEQAALAGIEYVLDNII